MAGLVRMTDLPSSLCFVSFGGGPCESNAPETDWSPAGFEDRKGHQPPLPSAEFQSYLPHPSSPRPHTHRRG
jgi:hypothetical protein